MVEENEANAPVAEGRRQGAKEPAHKPDFWARRPAKTLRIVLHVFNAIVVAVSVVAIVAAIFDLSVLSSYSQVARCRNKVSGVIVIVVVAIGIGLAVYGSYSASKWKRQGLHVEAGGMLVLLVVLVAVAGVILVQRPSEETFLKDRLTESFARTPSSQENRDGWDKVHQALSCCGNTGPRDFSRPMTPPHVPPDVALSCCTNGRPNATNAENEHARRTCINQKLYYQDGCQKLVADLFEGANGVVSSIILLALLQALGLIVTGGILFILSLRRNFERARQQTILDIVVISIIIIGAMFTIATSIFLGKGSYRNKMVEAGGVFILVNCMLLLTGLVVVFIVGPYRVKNGRI